MNTVEATLTPAAATSSLWDVVVIGAGCAGAMAAREIARRGASTLLLDKSGFPRWKVCGGCVNRRAQSALEAVGLGDLLEREGAVPIESFIVGTAGTVARLSLPRYRGLSRERLDAALVRSAINCGAHFLPKAHAVCSTANCSSRSVDVRVNEATITVRARLVVVANGLGGQLLKTQEAITSRATDESLIGAGAVVESVPDEYLHGAIYMACGAGGYAGVTRLEFPRIGVAAAVDPAYVRRKGSLAATVASILAEAKFPPIPHIEDLAWRGTPGLTRTMSAVAAKRAFVIGDAAGYVEPFTGEGMAWALASGVAVANLACDSLCDFSVVHMRNWETLHGRLIRRRQRVCRAVTASLRRPGLVRCAVGVLNVLPWLATPVIRHMNAPNYGASHK